MTKVQCKLKKLPENQNRRNRREAIFVQKMAKIIKYMNLHVGESKHIQNRIK
jgi:hypothetical protein